MELNSCPQDWTDRPQTGAHHGDEADTMAAHAARWASGKGEPSCSSLPVCGGNVDVLARTGITCILLPGRVFPASFLNPETRKTGNDKLLCTGLSVPVLRPLIQAHRL